MKKILTHQIAWLHALTCKYHNNGESKLTLFSLESPYNHILNSAQSDWLVHCVKVSHISRQMKAMKYCAKLTMVQFHSWFTGVDTMNITSHSDFSITSYLLSHHENTSITDRHDIWSLLNQKVKRCQISTDLEQLFIDSVKNNILLAILKICSKFNLCKIWWHDTHQFIRDIR